MKSHLILFYLVFFTPLIVAGQKKSKKTAAQTILSVPMTSKHWSFQESKVEFLTHKNVPALKIQQGGGLAVLKNLNFSNGIIEFDAEPMDAAAAPFVSVYFRFQNEEESECFYLRVGRAENNKRNDAVQYAPFIKGVNIWDMLGHFQGPAHLNNKDWNHIKLVVSGLQLRAYVNDMINPALEIPYLEGDSKQGTLALEGFAAFANLTIKPDAVEGLPSVKGVDLTNHDANYIRHWFVNKPVPLPLGRELFSENFPGAETVWDSIHAERNGLINLTRKFGVGNRQFIWLKANLRAAKDQRKKIDFGFSDEVWVFLNKQMVYVDKNLYLQGMRKTPNGRCSIENASFTIPLKAGDNELLIGVANDFYGWGIIARLESLDDIEIVSRE